MVNTELLMTFLYNVFFEAAAWTGGLLIAIGLTIVMVRLFTKIRGLTNG